MRGRKKEKKKKGSSFFPLLSGDQVRTISKPHSLVPFFFFLEFCLACALQSQMKWSIKCLRWSFISYVLVGRPFKYHYLLLKHLCRPPPPPLLFFFAARFLSSRWVRVRYNDIRSTLGALPSWLLFSGAQYESQLETVLGRFFSARRRVGLPNGRINGVAIFQNFKNFLSPGFGCDVVCRAENMIWIFCVRG